MKFKTSFARVVSEAQFVETVIEAQDEEEARLKFEASDFKRFLITKRDLREVTPVGSPTFERI